MAKPKTLTQQYNALRRKAEKALALPENAGLGLKLPKRPKKITRKSVARMENFNASVKQKNFLRSLRRQERRKISRQNYWERLRQDPQKYEEVKRRRSEGMKRYWEDLKRNKPEEYAERLAKMQRGAAEYRRKVKEGTIHPTRYKNKLTETDVVDGTSSRSEAMKKYWDDLKINNPEKYEERIRRLRESQISKQHKERVNEILKEAEEELKQEVGEIQFPIDKLESISPKSPQDMTDEELTEFMRELSKAKPSSEAQKEIEKQFEEWVDSMQSPSIEPPPHTSGDIETPDQLEIPGLEPKPIVTGFEEGQPISFADDFELGSFESVLVDQIYEQNFADIMNGVYLTDNVGATMLKQFVDRLSSEFDSKDEVKYFIAESISNGDLELNRHTLEDSKITAKEVADKLLVALDRWMTNNFDAFERHFGFNKNDFADMINEIADRVDEGNPDWMIDEMYPHTML